MTFAQPPFRSLLNNGDDLIIRLFGVRSDFLSAQAGRAS